MSDSLVNDHLALLYVITIGMNLMCALFIGVSKLKNYGKQFKAVFASCILIAVFQYSNWQYHLSADLDQAVFWLKAQTLFVLLCIPVVSLVFAFWCGVKQLKPYFLILLPAIAMLVVVNFLQPYGMRMSADALPMMVKMTVFSNESAFRVSGEVSKWVILYLAVCFVALAMFSVWLARAWRSLAVSDRYILLATMLLQVGVTVLSGFTDRGDIDLAYLGGFPFTFLNILCCLRFSNLLEQKSTDIDNLVYQREALEKILTSISGSAANMPIDEFFKNVISNIQSVSGATTGIILVFEGSTKDRRLKTAVAVHKQRLIDSFSFSISDVPEDFRDPSEFHIVSSGLCEKYADVEFYSNIKAQAMISAPMFNQSQEPIGIMSLFFSKPSVPDASFVNVVKVCASRLAAEYTREILVSELEEIAYIDVQTQLPNVIQLNKVLKATEAEFSSSAKSSIVIKIDIDGFSELNRKYGFDRAEDILKVLGKRMAEYASEDVFIARNGGDEFTLVASRLSQDSEAMVDMHWRALQALVQRTIVINNESFHLQCSAGSIIYPQQVPEGLDVMRCAEFALSQAKQKGKNRLQAFDAQMIQTINRRKLIEKELRAQLADTSKPDMFVVYQPKVTANGKLVSAEALSRWQHPDLGAISPEEFIDIAESAGLIDTLGLWCISEVCKQLEIWRASGFVPAGRIGINVSAQQFEDDGFVEKLLATLNIHGVKPAQIDLELTESSLMKSIDNSVNTLKVLRKNGFSISLDDFGTGYSSLSYLKDLPIDYLKIDRSFIVDAQQERSLFLLQSILSIGSNMKVKTVAEGVEELEQIELLQKLGCDYYQGYYFSRPIRADEFKAWCLAN